MKVRWKEKNDCLRLTSGREYEVISTENGWYRIIDDSGEDSLYPPERFEIVEPATKILNLYNEFADNTAYPSMQCFFEKEPYPFQNQIVSYLEKGTKTFASTGFAYDCFTGDKISIEPCGMTDGEYSWYSTLAYYVKKYNLRLDSEFEEKVINLVRTSLLSCHEKAAILRSGNNVWCKKCGSDIMKPIGDCKKTNTFICSTCNNQIIID